MSYLLGIKLGPVQSYIEESEKLMDLRNSSKIFSDIMREIIKYVFRKDEKSELIYPKYHRISDLDKLEDCTNFLVFTITQKESLELSKMESYLSKCFGIGGVWREAFYLFWALEPFSEGENYQIAYCNLQRLIQGIKHTYIFDNRAEIEVRGQGKEKCKICGKRLIYSNQLCRICFRKREYNVENYQSVNTISIACWKKTYSKTLKGVDELLRSIFNYEDKYYSISEIENTILMLKNNNTYSQRYQDYLHDLKSTERMQKFEIETLEEIKKRLIQLYEKSTDIYEPGYEYAFIQIDIDSLGSWMSGKFFSGEKESLKDYQEKISDILIKYGNTLRKELDPACNIIYAGGDDFLAILPVEMMFKTLEQIEQMFNVLVQKRLEAEKIMKVMTYSSCVTIAPCKSPIGEVINKSRIELNQVKSRYESKGKNGVAFNYIVGDRASATVYMRKNEFREFTELIWKYREIKDFLSLSFIRKYEKEAMEFSYERLTLDQFTDLREINKIELKRIIGRSKLSKKENEDSIGLVQEFIDRLPEFVDSCFGKGIHQVNNLLEFDFKNLSNILNVFERICKFEGGYTDELIENKTL